MYNVILYFLAKKNQKPPIETLNRRFYFYLFHSIFLEKYITAASIKNNPILPTNKA